ncbi:TPA: flagellar motor switch protein FliM [Candidatus Gastranaerophilales bacterium HUM_13]|jgi:flagellar motor switch protein FliM|nr:flagellar motor switch protein FliM [Acinetobacter sp.]CCZ49868.1 flagellar motor switch protein FliM [Acinetobacter sp. CAG:196]DAA86483.1 MAG TPA: flagellar motor switch protein FliM [Candidatus Gastranaerophilales bacterium HUM_4]DAA92797.1 MAG TPA: flagellar motor switch protein FliM [Candidatus Gastranaerophilales bacterium HUM_5]DAA94847.1 MAG TPA: flagellar motor switch protein FliM [Candidatus Gastranaerophilales bacterium HUM_8]DAA99772.1 MAG TPA: flagellar motor switch protein Fli
MAESINNNLTDTNFFEDEFSDSEHKSYKLYNFRRPDKFSKDNLRALRDIHREFSKAISLVLSGYLRMRVEIEIVSVDQLTYEEFVRSMPSPISVGVFEFEPLSGQVLLGISFEVISCIVNRMLGGVGNIENQTRELTDIEKALAKKVINIIIKSLEDSWNTIIPVTGKFISLDDNYQSIQVATAGEIVALLTFEVQISGKHFGLFSLCFPYPVLETVLGHLSTQHIFQTKGLVASNDERLKMISKINTSNVDLRVQFGQCSITLDDFLQLSEGDIIKLDNKVQDDLIVKVNGEKKFFARPGTLKDKICVKITDVYDEMHELLRNYF